ncbi:MAG: tetratricopeptide repeat protein [Pyrinomonadaceae bacterium]
MTEENEKPTSPLDIMASLVAMLLEQSPPQIPDEQLLKFLAIHYWRGGRIEESLASLRLIERRQELSTLELGLRGYWQLYVGDGEGARETFSNALRLEGDEPGARLGYAYALFYLNDYRAAAEVFQKLADEFTSLSSPPIMAAASSALAAGERPEMIQFPPLPELPEGLSEALQTKMYYGTIPAIKETLSRLAALAPEEQMPLRRLLAELYLESGQEQQALELLNELPRDDGVVACLMGIALSRAERNDEALDAFFRASRQAPLYARVWGGLAACYIDLGEFERAVKLFQIALFLDDRDAHFWSDMGIVEGQLKNYEQGRLALTKAIKLGRRNFTNFFNRGLYSFYLMDAESAVADWKSAIAIEPLHHRAAEVEALIQQLKGTDRDDRFVFGETEISDS